MTHFKDRLIPMPVAGEPGTFAIRFAGIRHEGTKAECARVADGIQAAASRLAGDAAVAEARQAEYAETWAPLLARKSLPGYLAERVPGWAREMHDAAEASDAVA